MGANDDAVLEWIGPVKELIRDAVAEGVPTLGICLGHQLMGAALGGRVTPNPRGQQVGLLEVGWTDEARHDRLFGGLATPRRGVQWNYDLVVEPPADAVILARTDDGEIQVARYAAHAWGVQLHPEVDETVVATWVTDSERTELADRGFDADELVEEIRGGPRRARPRLGAAGGRVRRRRAGPADAMTGHPTTDQGQPDPARLPGPRAVARPARPPRRGRRAAARFPRPHRRPRPGARLAGPAGRGRRSEQSEELLGALVDDEGTAMRLLSVLGASIALADHLCRHPEHWRELTDPTMGSTRPAAYAVREDLLRVVGADPRGRRHRWRPGPTTEAVDALRVEYRRVLLRLASRDLTHHLGVSDAAAELSDLAAGTLEAALAVARQRVGETAATARLAVVAMGKCGGHELNYVSDVDVIFVHEPVDGAEEGVALKAASQLASHLMRVCSEHTARAPSGRSTPRSGPRARRGR